MSRGLFAEHPVSFSAAMARGLFRAQIVSARDGDTVVALIDQALNTYRTLALRVAGVDAPEIVGGTAESQARATAARAWVDANVVGRWALVRTYKSRTGRERVSFDRYEADVTVCEAGPEWDLADELVRAGHAVRVAQ